MKKEELLEYVEQEFTTGGSKDLQEKASEDVDKPAEIMDDALNLIEIFMSKSNGYEGLSDALGAIEALGDEFVPKAIAKKAAQIEVLANGLRREIDRLEGMLKQELDELAKIRKAERSAWSDQP